MDILKNAETAVKLLIETQKKIAIAESCTGGLLAGAITSVSGSSNVFDFGAVTYSNEMKQKLLGVKADTLEKYGAVSEQTAKEMAEGILKYSNSDFGIGITGIAGPGSDNTNKPVGLIYIGIASEKGTLVRELNNSFTVDVRENNRKKAVYTALKMLISQLTDRKMSDE